MSDVQKGIQIKGRFEINIIRPNQISEKAWRKFIDRIEDALWEAARPLGASGFQVLNATLYDVRQKVEFYKERGNPE